MHSLLSDGELIPSELVRRCEALGYRTIAITDHVDESNIEFVISNVIKVSEQFNSSRSITVIPGVEITYVPPSRISEIVKEARKLGAKLVVVHGETIVEPVLKGTNMAGIEAGADILAHPGLITSQEAERAANKGVYLEISARKGHCLTNGHVAKIALNKGACLLINSDAHAPEDLITQDQAFKIAQGAGLPPDFFNTLLSNAMDLIKKAMEVADPHS